MRNGNIQRKEGNKGGRRGVKRQQASNVGLVPM